MTLWYNGITYRFGLYNLCSIRSRVTFDSDEYVEIKGHLWERDIIKLEAIKNQHPKVKLKVLKKEDIL